MDGAIRRADDLRPAATTIAAADLDAARFGFHRAHKHRSARRTFYVTQMLAFAALLALVVWSFKAFPTATGETFHAIAITLFASAILLRFAAAAHVAPLLSPLTSTTRYPIYTILCPLYREAGVVGDLVAALERLDYPGTE